MLNVTVRRGDRLNGCRVAPDDADEGEGAAAAADESAAAKSEGEIADSCVAVAGTGSAAAGTESTAAGVVVKSRSREGQAASMKAGLSREMLVALSSYPLFVGYRIVKWSFCRLTTGYGPSYGSSSGWRVRSMRTKTWEQVARARGTNIFVFA